MENTRQGIELADIFRSYAEQAAHNHNLCYQQQKAYKAIMQCRTEELGGHISQCDTCGYTRQAYNSCRNRHCPKCQYVKQAKWVDKLASNLPPVRHFHLVFTIPQALHKLFYINQEKAYGLLFKAAGKSLDQCSRNPDYLGVQTGAVAILHTWGQTLTYHPHIHMIVPGGGLSEDGQEWVPAKKRFFLPVKALSALFRGILCRMIALAITQGEIKLPEDEVDFSRIKSVCYKKNWVVYCEKPFSNRDNLIQYLGNYTHRVAISNHRIVRFENGKVCFRYKDYKNAGIRRQITLTAGDFIRRFMWHVLPDGFYKIRYFGFMAMCNKQSKLVDCFNHITTESLLASLEGLSALEVFRTITGKDPLCCPKCKHGKVRLKSSLNVKEIPPG